MTTLESVMITAPTASARMTEAKGTAVTSQMRRSRLCPPPGGALGASPRVANSCESVGLTGLAGSDGEESTDPPVSSAGSDRRSSVIRRPPSSLVLAHVPRSP